MMAKIVVTVKFFFVWLYNLSLAWVPSVLGQITGHSDFVVDFLVVMIFAPELLYAFKKDFREWINGGVEDGDGKLDKTDLKDIIPLYMGLWCTRVFIYFSWQISEGKDIETSIYLIPLYGAFGLGSVPVMGKGMDIIKKKMLKLK